MQRSSTAYGIIIFIIIGMHAAVLYRLRAIYTCMHPAVLYRLSALYTRMHTAVLYRSEHLKTHT